MTLELSLDRKARCQEIGSGTAITVGVEPTDTETRIATGFVTARTTQCDDDTGRIGTLVVTPGESGSRASVVVVAGYKGKDSATCMPPLYEGCIVARRRFAFSEHTRLRMPIVIDPDCAGVPCDAFSTCSNGALLRLRDALHRRRVRKARCAGGRRRRRGWTRRARRRADRACRRVRRGPVLDVLQCEGPRVQRNGMRPDRPVCCFASGAGTTCEPACADADRVCCEGTDCKRGFHCVRSTGARLRPLHAGGRRGRRRRAALVLRA